MSGCSEALVISARKFDDRWNVALAVAEYTDPIDQRSDGLKQR